jgi:hypothetical protein
VGAVPPPAIARALAAWAGSDTALRLGSGLGAYAALGWAPVLDESALELTAADEPADFLHLAEEPAVGAVPELPASALLLPFSEPEAISEPEMISEPKAISEPEMISEPEAITEAKTALLPEWLLERAAKDLTPPPPPPPRAGIDGEPAAETEVEADLLTELQGLADDPAAPDPAPSRYRRVRHPKRIAALVGLVIAVPIGLGLLLRDPSLTSLLPGKERPTPPPAGPEHPIQAGASGVPSSNDLLGEARPWQRVVAGEGAAGTSATPATPPGATASSGRIEARTEPYLANVMVTVDGKSIGNAPVSLEGLAPGKHLVAFDGGSGRRWEEEVTVVPGDVAVAVAPLGAPATQGLVEVIATTMHDDGPADEEVQVLVNGEVRGATPLDLTLDPGTHSIALDLGGERLVHRVIEVRPGDRQVLEIPVDVPPPFVIQHRPAASLAAAGTAILTVEVRGPAGTATYLDLRVEEGGTFQAFPMGPVPGAPGTYAVGLPISRERHGKRLRYYFVTAAEGELPVVTKIFTVPLR